LIREGFGKRSGEVCMSVKQRIQQPDKAQKREEAPKKTKKFRNIEERKKESQQQRLKGPS
jgi:hypothetical protein